MPDQWGRPQFGDYANVMQGMNAISSMQDRMANRQYVDDVNTSLSAIRSAGDVPLKDVQKPDDVQEAAWAAAMQKQYDINSMDNNAKIQHFNAWKADIGQKKMKGEMDAKKLTKKLQDGVDHKVLEQGLIRAYGEDVYDSADFVGKENREGKNVYVLRDRFDGTEFTMDAKPIPEMIRDFSRYVSEDLEKFALSQKARRTRLNQESLLNPIYMQNASGEKMTVYKMFTRGDRGNQPILVKRNPETNDLEEISAQQLAGRGFGPVNLDDQYKLAQIEAAQARRDSYRDSYKGANNFKAEKEIRDNMAFILKQLGIRNPDAGEIDITGERMASPISKVMEKASSGSSYEKQLANQYISLANQLYPGQNQQQEQPNPFKLDPGTINEMKEAGNNTPPMQAPATTGQPHTSNDILRTPLYPVELPEGAVGEMKSAITPWPTKSTGSLEDQLGVDRRPKDPYKAYLYDRANKGAYGPDDFFNSPEYLKYQSENR